MSGQVDVEVEQWGDVVVARVTGELDLAVSGKAGEQLGEAVPTSAVGMVVDLRGLGFIDSSGVAVLFTLARRLSERRQQLRVVVAPEGPVAKVLDLVGYHRAAPVEADLDRARSALGGGVG